MRVNIGMPAGSGDRWPEDYERGRPGWPRKVLDVPGLPSAATVLELGAGTGKLTRLLVSRFGRVVAVEPAEAMRRVLVPLCPEAEVLAGSAEEIPLGDAAVDAVFAAEAFHWFDSDRGLAEIARVLRPRGALVAMWNLPAGPTDPSIAAVEQLLLQRSPDRAQLGVDPLDLNTTRYESGEWRLALAQAPFEELQEARLANPADPRPGGAGRVLRVDGLDRRPRRRGQAPTPRRGEVAPGLRGVPAALGDARHLDATSARGLQNDLA
jgi:ubiquinone/menaquinone biosynthesis C-methylase UbiE